MTETNLVDHLAALKTFRTAPRSELEWLASRGTVRHLETGEVLSAKGQPVLGLFVVLSGSVAIHVDRSAGPHKVMEWREGDVTGVLRARGGDVVLNTPVTGQFHGERRTLTVKVPPRSGETFQSLVIAQNERTGQAYADFTSTSRLEAARYAVLVAAEHADAARGLLAQP